MALFPRAKPPPEPPLASSGSRSFGPDHPALLLKRIEFEILRRLDGFLFGDYSGLFYGPSLDLAEVREYQPGDEVRRIDWNVTARSGSLHVRQYREEREVLAWLIVDLSASMAFGTRRVSKQELAFEFAGLAASVLARRGNKVGSLGYSEAGFALTPLASGRRTPLLLLRSLMEAASKRDGHEPGRRAGSERGATDKAPPGLEGAVAQANRTQRRKALVFLISDFIDPLGRGKAWEGELRRLALRHEVIAVQISDPAEQVLPSVGDLRLRDPETGQEMWIDTSDARLRREHERMVAERQAATEQLLRSARVDLLKLSTSEEIVSPVVRFTVARRGKRP